MISWRMKNQKIIRRTRKPPSAPGESQTQPRRRILVVEADSDIRQVSMELLMRSGYLVDTALDAATAWEALNTVHYDLVIMDETMPKVSGIELPRKLRAAHLALPLHEEEEGKLSAPGSNGKLRLQPTATLLMPYTVAEFLGTVRAILSATAAAPEPMTPAVNGQSLTAVDGAQIGWEF
jgi:CheY-like chemotaxis protein